MAGPGATSVADGMLEVAGAVAAGPYALIPTVLYLGLVFGISEGGVVAKAFFEVGEYISGDHSGVRHTLASHGCCSRGNPVGR